MKKLIFARSVTPNIALLKLFNMVFLLASFDEFTLFLKIVLWIAVPLIIVSFLVTTILHYRQKKKNALRAEENPELPIDEVIDISLVSRLQKEVLHYKRRIKELQHALTFAKEVIPPASLNSRVASLHEEVSALSQHPDLSDDIQAQITGNFRSTSGTRSEGLQVPGTATGLSSDPGFIPGSSSGSSSGSLIGSGPDSIPESLTGARVGSIDDSYQGSRADSIPDSLPGYFNGSLPASDPESPASAAYLNDLVNEQKTHVLFLQQQLESRIKAFHELEFQFRDNATLLEKMTLSYEHIKHQLDDSDAAASMHRIEKDSMQAQISRLENSLKELQEQHNKSLKMLDQNSVNPVDKTQEIANGKPPVVKINESELSETGHS